MDEELIIGRNPVIEALKSGRTFRKVMISDRLNKKAYKELDRYCKHRNIKIQRVPRHQLDQLARGNHQGVIAHVEPHSYATIDDLFMRAEQCNELPFFIIL